ncbi:MAG: VCBS repeat-containing protein [Phycisphaerales bacterium]|nr:VCBS repeat-containing protein [Phycisphaerales bacterium]
MCRFAAVFAVVGLFCASTSLGQGQRFFQYNDGSSVEFAHIPSAGQKNMMPGCAVADFNRDGFQDFFVCGSERVADALFINNGDGTFTNQATEWGVAVMHTCVGVSAGDYNNDGWIDLYVTSHGVGDNPATSPNKLYRNNHGQSFSDVAAEAGVADTSLQPDSYGSAWGDYDLDGDLDLAIGAWATGSNRGNRLYRNNGDGTFTDVTIAMLGADIGQMWGFTPRFVDLNHDRWPDLLFVSDFASTRYYQNMRGTFQRRTTEAGLGYETNGMGCTIGDFNNDGRIDVYVTSIYYPGNPAWMRGNAMYINQGAGQFQQVAAAVGTQIGGWGWGTAACDFDLDGDQDILETNGWSNYPFLYEQCYLYVNRLVDSGRLMFSEQAIARGIDFYGQGRGIGLIDFENDGDMDVVITGFGEAKRMFLNAAPASNPGWLRVFLRDGNQPGVAPDGFGAYVRTRVGSRTQARYMDGAPSFLSTSELSAHFGFGEVDTVDELRIEWPNGGLTVLRNVPTRQTLTITAQPTANRDCLGDLTRDGRVMLDDVYEMLIAYGSVAGDDAFRDDGDFNRDEQITLTDLARMIANFGAECSD